MNNFYYTLDFFYLCDMHAVGAKSIAFAGTTVQELGSSGTTGRVGGGVAVQRNALSVFL